MIALYKPSEIKETPLLYFSLQQYFFIMNELIFFLHIAAIFLFTLGSLRIGKEALITWICLQAVLANLFVLKQTVLFGYTVTCSDAFAVGTLLGLNIMQEYYGKDAAKKTGQICFFCMILFSLFAKIHLLYIPAIQDHMHPIYEELLTPAPRLLLASLFVFFLVQKIDRKIFHFLKCQKNPSPFAVRNLFSLSISQLLDTVLFTFLGLYGVLSNLGDIICISFLLKTTAALLLTPTLWLLTKYIPPTKVLS